MFSHSSKGVRATDHKDSQLLSCHMKSLVQADNAGEGGCTGDLILGFSTFSEPPALAARISRG